MENLKARTEIHDAWTNVILADGHLAEGRSQDAETAILDAERHLKSAQLAITIEKSGAVLNNLADLKIKLDQVRSAARAAKTVRRLIYTHCHA
jgi:hypothetical protein